MKFLVFFLVGTIALSTATLAGDSGDRQDVSLVRLIVHPEKYDGRRVTVRGYLIDAGGVIFLVLTREASLSKDATSGVPVSGSSILSDGSMPCVGGYVTLTGTFGKVWDSEIFGIVKVERALLWDLEKGRATDCTYP